MKKTLSAFLALLLALLASCVVLPAGVSGANDDVVFVVDYSKQNNGVVDHKTTMEITKEFEKDGVRCIKVVPDPEATDANNLALDCYSIEYPSSDLAKVKYVGVKYFYEVPTGVSRHAYDKMYLNLLPNGAALKTAVGAKSTGDIVENQWDELIFNMSGIQASVQVGDDNRFRQFHLQPYGQNIRPGEVTAKEVMYISDITFYSTNPDKNATYKVEFSRGNPDASGENPAEMHLKLGETYTLPANPYTVEGGTFLGWRSSVDETVYQPGEIMTAIDNNVMYTAVFRVEKNLADYKALDFISYANGIVNHYDTASVYEAAEYDGKSVMKLVVNTDFEDKTRALSLDGWSYRPANIDLDVYRYVVITYYYDDPQPKNARFRVDVMVNGNILTKSFGNNADEPLKTGRWEFAVIDLSGIVEALNPNTDDHILRQMHIKPYQGLTIENFTGNETMYINQVIFFKDKPKLDIHESYIKGYDGGLFKPANTMTRAEACTIVARLAAGSDEEVPTDIDCSFTDVASDAWYHKYIAYVQNKGLLASYSDAFLPDQAITRAEFVELVYNMGLLTDSGKNGVFTDVDTSHPRYFVITAAGKAGLVNGYDNGDGTFSFKPDSTITRAEVVKVINNAYGRSVTRDKLSSEVTYSFNDVEPDFWAFADICEASLPHVEMGGKWVYAMISPASVVGGDARIDKAAGDAFILELDEKTAKRIAEIRNTPTEIEVKGTKYYVSNDGDDNNDGKSPETAWRTVAQVNKNPGLFKSGDAVLFRRGDIFRERLNAKSGLTYSAYGEGEKPRFYGSPENGADPSKWTLVPGTTNLWVYAREMNDVGVIIFNDGEAVGYKEVPNYKNGTFWVRDSNNEVAFDIKVHLDKDLEFFHKADSRVISDNIDMGSSVGKLYLRCDAGNPGSVYKSIEFNTRGNVIGGTSNVHFDNLCVMYGGSHGIGNGSVVNLKITNCEIGWIGGSIQTYNFRTDKTGRATRFGNGIEVYGSCDGYTIDNCYVHQCYDAGVTHQFSGGGTAAISMNNVTYSNNVIEDCIYSVEYFNGDGDTEAVRRDGKNYKILNNIMRRAGYGFGSQRPDGKTAAHLKGWTSRNEYEKGSYVVQNNIFDRASWCMFQVNASYAAWLPVFDGNTYVQKLDASLGYYGAERMPYDNIADKRIENTLGDKNATVYFCSEGLFEG